MHLRIQKIHQFLIQSNYYLLVFAFSILGLLESLLHSFLNDFFQLGTSGPSFESKTELFWVVVVVAPLVETFIFQLSIFYLMSLLTKNKMIALLVSALLFGLSHSYSLLYIFSGLMGGLLLGYAYIIFQVRKKYPFWSVSVIHSLNNLYLFLIFY